MSRDPDIAHPDFEDKFFMLELLATHLNANDDNTFTYDPDWSDRRVAEAVQPTGHPNTKYEAHHAAAVRRMKFGLLSRKAQAPEPTPPSPSRIDILEARISRIIDILSTNSPRSAQHRRYLLDGSSSTAHLDDI